MKPLSSLLIVSLLLAASPISAETVTVDPKQSLQEAADKLNPGDTLLLAEGTYYQSLIVTKSGTAGSPITIKAGTPGKVVITGAMEKTPKFEKVQGDVYTTEWGSKNWKGSGTGQAWVIAWKIRHCYFHDCFDGIESAATVDKDPALLNAYSYNLLQNCADDSIEFDTMEYAGVHVHHNVFLDGFCMLGLSPVQAGGVTVEYNIVYVSPEYGMPWGVIFKFSTPSGSAWWRGGFHPLTGMTIRNNTLVHTMCGVQWGADPKHNPYFKDSTLANNIIYARDWQSWGGLPCKLRLAVERNNLCCGPSLAAGKGDVPEGVLWTRNTEPFVRRDTHRWEGMAPLLPALAAEGETGEGKEISRVNFSVSEEYVRAAIKESGLPEAEYKEVHKNLGAVPPGTKWEFPRPGPRWAVSELALFRPPLPPSLDPWWVGFADKPSDAKTVKIRPWRGKAYKDNASKK